MISSNKEYKKYIDTAFNKLRVNNQTVKPSKYFGLIGSTQYEDIEYKMQLEVKLSALREMWKEQIDQQTLQTYTIEASPKIYNYRFKMDFVCSFNPLEEPNNKFGQRKKKRFNKVEDMFECNLISEDWFSKTRQIFDFLISKNIQCYDLVKHIGYLRYLVIREYNNIAMLNIVTVSNEHASEIEMASKLALELGFASVNWIINSSNHDDSNGQKIKSFGTETITIPVKSSEKNYNFSVNYETFFQNNIPSFENILNYISSYLTANDFTKMKLYDLFCGVGLLGIYFSKNFNEVEGFELNEESVKLARLNALNNDIKNASFLVSDLNSDIIDLNITLNQVAIVDPPRVGLQKHGIRLIKQLSPRILIYISCNPVTQIQDFIELKDEYKVLSIRGFDLFPHTFHIENVLILERIKQ